MRCVWRELEASLGAKFWLTVFPIAMTSPLSRFVLLVLAHG